MVKEKTGDGAAQETERAPGSLTGSAAGAGSGTPQRRVVYRAAMYQPTMARAQLQGRATPAASSDQPQLALAPGAGPREQAPVLIPQSAQQNKVAGQGNLTFQRASYVDHSSAMYRSAGSSGPYRWAAGSRNTQTSTFDPRSDSGMKASRTGWRTLQQWSRTAASELSKPWALLPQSRKRRVLLYTLLFLSVFIYWLCLEDEDAKNIGAPSDVSGETFPKQVHVGDSERIEASDASDITAASVSQMKRRGLRDAEKLGVTVDAPSLAVSADVKGAESVATKQHVLNTHEAQASLSVWEDDSVLSVAADGSGTDPSAISSCGQHGGSAAPGVALVAVCMNRHATYAAAIKTWLRAADVDEIIVVDWSSEPPLEPPAEIPRSESRLRFIRVEGEKQWVLSRAFNLGLAFACHDVVVRLDCDYELAPDFVAHHALDETMHSFYAGNWKRARNANEAHLNGALVLRLRDFWGVGGYDERIQTYGWDDEDLYDRLQQKRSLKRLDVNPDLLQHIAHADSGRAQAGVRFAKVQVDYNRLLLEKLPSWKTGGVAKGSDAVEGDDEGCVLLSRYDIERRESVSTSSGGAVRKLQVRNAAKPRSLLELSGSAAARDQWLLSLGRRLHDEHSVPWDVMMGMDAKNREKLLSRLLTFLGDDGSGSLPQNAEHAALFILHAKFGLGSRLLALASAMGFSKVHRMQLIVIWERDVHLDVAFEELFDLSEAPFAISSFFKTGYPDVKHSDKWDSAWKNFAQICSFLTGEDWRAAFSKPLLMAPAQTGPRHIYWKSDTLLSPQNGVSWPELGAQLHSLKSAQYIDELLHKRLDMISSHTSGRFPEHGVHMRTLSSTEERLDIDYVRTFGKRVVAELDQARQASSVANFIPVLRRTIADGEHVLVVSDSTAAASAARDALKSGVAIVLTPFGDAAACSGPLARTPSCVQEALVDLHLLGRTASLIGSRNSSFTLAAALLQTQTHLSFIDA